MRKFLLLLTAAMSLSLSLGAHQVPAHIELTENQRILGHYQSDAIGTEGVGLRTTGKLTIGVILDAEELAIFNGGKIVAFRVGLAESTPVTKVFVQPIAAGGAYGSMTSWACDVSEAGWNTVQLPQPHQLNLTDGGKLIIGFEYEQTSTNKPLALVQEPPVYDTYIYKKAGQMYRWATAGISSYGNLCVQCIVEKDHFPVVMIKPSDLVVPTYFTRGESMPFTFNVKNNGNAPIEAQALTFDVKVNGEKVSTVTNADVIEAGGTVTCQGELDTQDLESGDYTLTIDHPVAGEEVLDYVFPLSASFKLHSGDYPRQNHLIEQLTSTYCTFCPLGISMLDKFVKQRDDVIWVAYHGELNGGKDPFMTDQGDSIMTYLSSAISYPSGAFDRACGFENPNQMINSLGYYEEYHEQTCQQLSDFFDQVEANDPTFATINIKPVVDVDTREAVITVSGEMTPDFDLLMGSDNKLTVYLTEDSLVARQLNLGTWVSTFRHNGVFRQALGSAKGVDFNRVEGGYSNEFTVTIPEDWNIYNLNVVAFISRPVTNGANFQYTDMKVNNAEVVRLAEPTHGIEEILTDGNAVPVEYYDVMGHRMDGPSSGINIVRMSNGTAVKVLVK